MTAGFLLLSWFERHLLEGMIQNIFYWEEEFLFEKRSFAVHPYLLDPRVLHLPLTLRLSIFLSFLCYS